MPEPTTTTAIDPATASVRELTAALRRAADGADMRAAVELLVGYNDGDLLDYPEVRATIEAWGPDGARVHWTDLHTAATEDDAGDLALLSETGRGALLLACALKVNVPIGALARTLGQLDQANSLVALHAFALALGINGTAALAAHATARNRDAERLAGVVSGLRYACRHQADGGAALYVRPDVEPTGSHEVPLVLAVPVSDILPILDGNQAAR